MKNWVNIITTVVGLFALFMMSAESDSAVVWFVWETVWFIVFVASVAIQCEFGGDGND